MPGTDLKTLLQFILMTLFIPVSAGCGFAQNDIELPVLKWQVPADWVDITKETDPKAAGNGKADDTDAIQTALNRLLENGYGQPPATIYFPPGTYRITRTLHLKNKRGIMLVGAGRNSRIVWDGPAGGTMYWSDGVAYCRYVGLIWDGNNQAGTGHLHASNSLFETRVTYEHTAFMNLEFGLRTGKNRQFATAESWYENCLFQNCKVGIGLYHFNDYNHTVYGCLFKNCGYGVFTEHGTAYVLNSRFENSSEVDFMANGEHGQSIRRCVSVGSGGLLVHQGIGPLVVQDCYVSGWTHPTAIRLAGRAPAMVFDCRFENPPADQAPIQLTRGAQAIMSNNRNGRWMYEDLTLRSTVTEVPPGKLEGVIDNDRIHFLRKSVDTPRKIFDARDMFGAKGNAIADDTLALQRTIAAAKKHGRGAMAYLPPGIYRITDSLVLSGRNYIFGGGIAHHTQIRWDGPDHGSAVEVDGPQNLVLQQVSVHIPKAAATSVCAIRQANSSPGSRMTYDGVYVPGKYWKEKRRPRGFECINPAKGAVVHVKHMDGEMRFVDCGNATVFMNRSHDGELVVEGSGNQRDGFIGGLFRLSTISSDFAIRVLDNHSLVLSEWYHEQGMRHLLLQGGEGDPEGNVTIQGGKLHGEKNPVILIDNYQGSLVYGPQQWYGFRKLLPEIRQTGKRSAEVILLGNMNWDGPAPRINIQGDGMDMSSRNAWGKKPNSEKYIAKMAHTLDPLRALGAYDIKINAFQDGS